MIYALCDQEMIKKNHSTIEDFIKLASLNNAKIIQYRAKNLDLKEKKKNLLFIRSRWSGMLIINDEISLVKYCDGLHLGQEDLALYDKDFKIAVKKVRLIIADKYLGLSTHNQKEIKQANELNLDYIGLGAYRKTTTKKTSSALGEKLDSLAALSIHKVAVIGGVRLSDNFININMKVIGSNLYES